MSADPIARFRDALKRAGETESFDATRAALATADAQGRPSVRFVLVKAQSDRGFVFYTNFNSRKAHDLDRNPRAALAFHWSTTGLQVRVEGPVHRASDEMADAYFASRPRGSQIGAVASPQSSEIESREALLELVAATRSRFGDGPVPRPNDWGGYVLVPNAIEFWMNEDERLHERFLYRRDGDGGRWSMVRLAP